MTAPLKPLIAGNWKMNGLKASVAELRVLVDGLAAGTAAGNAEVMVAPPLTLLGVFVDAAKGTRVAIAAQDCHDKVSGAHTGSIAAEMIADLGAKAVIVGHSERRTDYGETDAIVQRKAAAALRAGLTAIVCIGETAGERTAGLTLNVVRRQLGGSLPEGASSANTVIAYEPVWAIGSGRVATPADIAEVHAAVREKLVGMLGADGQQVRILYGGSVKPDNAAATLAVSNVDGALVGGASLKASDFLAIIAAAVR